MALDVQEKAQIVADYQQAVGDTGSPEVQVALLTHNINKLQGQVTKAIDQLSDTGAGTVHLPVTSYHSATHAVPRRSKWAQMLPNHIITGKPNSGANFSYQFCQVFGVPPNLCFILAFDHNAHQRLRTGLA